MSPAALALVLAAAVVHALWNRRVHAVADRVAVMAVAGLVAAALLTPAILTHPPGRVWPLVLASGVAETLYAVLLAAAYARGSLAVAYPIGRGTAPLLVTLGAAVVLGQVPAWPAVLGALAVGSGLVVLAGVARSAGQLPVVGWAVATGASIATYSVIDATAVSRLTSGDGPVDLLVLPGYLGAAMGVQGLVLAALLPVARGGTTQGGSRDSGPVQGVLGRLRAAVRPGIGVGIGVTAAYLAVISAFALAPAGRVATLREASVLIAVALAPGRRSRLTWVGAALVVMGAVAVAV